MFAQCSPLEQVGRSLSNAENNRYASESLACFNLPWIECAILRSIVDRESTRAWRNPLATSLPVSYSRSVAHRDHYPEKWPSDEECLRWNWRSLVLDVDRWSSVGWIDWTWSSWDKNWYPIVDRVEDEQYNPPYRNAPDRSDVSMLCGTQVVDAYRVDSAENARRTLTEKQQMSSGTLTGEKKSMMNGWASCFTAGKSDGVRVRKGEKAFSRTNPAISFDVWRPSIEMQIDLVQLEQGFTIIEFVMALSFEQDKGRLLHDRQIRAHACRWWTIESTDVVV